MTKPTPGPWYVSTGLSCLIDSDGGMIGRCDVTDFRRDRSEENLANARLIAAAPEMYEALIEARAGLHAFCAGATADTISRCDKAIAKAEGR